MPDIEIAMILKQNIFQLGGICKCQLIVLLCMYKYIFMINYLTVFNFCDYKKMVCQKDSFSLDNDIILITFTLWQRLLL